MYASAHILTCICLTAGVNLLTLRLLMSYIYGAPILDVPRSHTTTQHSRENSSVRVISSSQRPLPDNTRHSQQTNIQAPGGFRTQDLSRRAAASCTSSLGAVEYYHHHHHHIIIKFIAVALCLLFLFMSYSRMS